MNPIDAIAKIFKRASHNEELDDQFDHDIFFRDMDGLRRCIAEGADPLNVPAYSYYARSSALTLASERGWLDGVRYFMKEQRVNVEAIDGSGDTALIAACRGSNLNSLMTVKVLVEEGQSEVDARNENGETVLHYASKNRHHLEALRYLIEEVEAKDSKGLNPLHHSMNTNLPVPDIIRLILSKSRVVDSYHLQMAWDQLLPFDIKLTMAKKYARYELDFDDDYVEKFPLHASFRVPLPTENAFIEFLRRFRPSTLSVLDCHGRLPIHVAAASEEIRRKPRVLSKILELEPTCADVRDLFSGLYPFETVAVGANDDKDSVEAVYRLFRCNPVHFLTVRGKGQH